jgi:hypothetical protein
MTRTSINDYDKVCASIKRWRTRLKRAINQLDKLEARKVRIERRLGLLEATVVESSAELMQQLRDSAALCDIAKRFRPEVKR